MIFELVQDLIIPKSQKEALGSDFYSKSIFGLSYVRTFQNHLEKVLEMEIVVVRKLDSKIIRTITKARFDQKGRQGDCINLPEVEAYEQNWNALQQELFTLEKKVALTKTETDRVEAINAELSQLTIVEKRYNYIDTYDEVVEYFDSKGILTEAGLAWGLSLEMLGSTIQSIIQI